MDPLLTPLRDWDRSTLDALVGRVESDILDAKHFESVDLGDSKKTIRKAIAGFASSAGGTLLIGATTKTVGDGAAEALHESPDVDVDEDVWRRIRQSIYDNIRPTPVIEDRLIAIDKERSVVVVVVRPNPLGLPASADGRYYQRVGDETREMDWDEVRRRFESVVDSERESIERAWTADTTLLHARPALCHSGKRALFSPPFRDPHIVSPYTRVVVLPLAGPGDLGTTARGLRDVLIPLLAEEHAIWERNVEAVAAEHVATT